MDETFAERVIKELPRDGGAIGLTFLRVYPAFKLFSRSIPLESVSPIYRNLISDVSKAGIVFNLNPGCIKVKDYLLFIRHLFPELDVEDCQNNRESGRPDFRLSNVSDRFHIEFKSSSDSIRPSQLAWIGSHPKEEVWFLILGDITTTGLWTYND